MNVPGCEQILMERVVVGLKALNKETKNPLTVTYSLISCCNQITLGFWLPVL